MKLKLEFTAEVIEELDGVDPKDIHSEEENKAILEHMLKQYSGKNAVVTVRQCRLIDVTEEEGR